MARFRIKLMFRPSVMVTLGIGLFLWLVLAFSVGFGSG